jgi:hypothetical protein
MRKTQAFSVPSEPTKNVFNTQGKSAPEYIAFSLEIFLFEIEIAWGKMLKQNAKWA